MAAVTICSDFGAQKNKVWHCFHCFPIYFPWSDGTGCHDLRFLNGDWLAGGKFRWLDLGALPAVLLIPAVQTRQMFPSDLQLLPLQYFTMWKTNSPIFQRWSSPHGSFLHGASFAFKIFMSSPIFSFSCMSRGEKKVLCLFPNQISTFTSNIKYWAQTKQEGKITQKRKNQEAEGNFKKLSIIFPGAWEKTILHTWEKDATRKGMLGGKGKKASWKLKSMIETMTYSKEEFKSNSREAPESWTKRQKDIWLKIRKIATT